MNKTIDLLKQLISFESDSKNVANETIQFCKEWLERQGLKPKIISNNGYDSVICNVGSGEKKLIFNGHVDVVSGKDSQFTPEIKNGKLYGRGSADMKAGVSAMMVALSELQYEALENVVVQLQLVSDEEIGGENCAKYITENGFLGDFVICGEPTHLGIGYQAKGILQFDIEIEGESAHGSRPWEGVNAIEKAIEVTNKLKKLPFAKQYTRLYEAPSINLAKISGGDVYNKVPDKCKLSYDIRYLPGQKSEEIISQIRTITDGNISIHLTGYPVENNEDNKNIQRLVDLIKKVTKHDKVNLFGQHGFADTRYFSKFGVPAIEFGPSGASWHGDGEYVVIESIDKYKEVLKQFAKNFK